MFFSPQRAQLYLAPSIPRERPMLWLQWLRAGATALYVQDQHLRRCGVQGMRGMFSSGGHYLYLGKGGSIPPGRPMPSLQFMCTGVPLCAPEYLLRCAGMQAMQHLLWERSGRLFGWGRGYRIDDRNVSRCGCPHVPRPGQTVRCLR
jgi:hypothetical protein